MKVLDLQCANSHVFEGWFASESDFVAQCERSLVQCPLCGDPSVVKKLSAPRLSLSGARDATAAPVERNGASSELLVDAGQQQQPTPEQVWLGLARQLLAQTTDVGQNFAEEARKIHYGESEDRAIRGTATVQEKQSLAEEGIEVLSFPIPQALKGQLQ